MKELAVFKFFILIFVFLLGIQPVATLKAQTNTGGGGIRIGDRIPPIVNQITRAQMIKEFKEIIELTIKFTRSLQNDWKKEKHQDLFKNEKKINLVTIHNILSLDSGLKKAIEPQIDYKDCHCKEELKIISKSQTAKLLEEILGKDYLIDFLMYEMDPGLSENEANGVKDYFATLLKNMREIKWEQKR